MASEADPVPVKIVFRISKTLLTDVEQIGSVWAYSSLELVGFVRCLARMVKKMCFISDEDQFKWLM